MLKNVFTVIVFWCLFLFCFCFLFFQTTFFTAIAHTESGGIITLDRTGRVCLFHVDGDRYVTYIKDTMGDLQTAIRVASDTGLQGAGGVFKERFKQLMQQGMYQQAAKLAAEAPGVE